MSQFPLRRKLAIFVSTLGFAGTLIGPLVGPASAAPKAGSQCKKRESGKSIGSLQCTAKGGKFIWVVVKPAGVTGNCNPAYKECVPFDSDVDCAGSA